MGILTPEALEEFKQIYLEEYGVELNGEELVKKASAVYNLYALIVDNSNSEGAL